MANDKPHVLIVVDIQGSSGIDSIIRMVERREPSFTFGKFVANYPPREAMEDELKSHLFGSSYAAVVVPELLHVLPVVRAQHTGPVIGYGIGAAPHSYDGYINTLAMITGGSASQYWIDEISKHLSR